MQTAASYEFVSGDLATFETLPPISTDAGSKFDLKREANLPGLAGGANEGNRNNTLFDLARKHAPHCDSIDALIDVLRTRNGEFVPPLTDVEVISTAKSVWRYQEEGRLFNDGQAHAYIARAELDRLLEFRNCPDANLLLILLRMEHGAPAGRGETFSISANAMAAANVLGDWSAARYRKARNTLEECGLIECIDKGGRKPRGASQYCFAQRGTIRTPM